MISAKTGFRCKCGACAFHWAPLPSDTVGRGIINACMLLLGTMWPYTSLTSPPILSNLLTKKKCEFLTYPLFSTMLPFPLTFLSLFHIWWLCPGILFKFYLPLPRFPIQSLSMYMLQEEEGCTVEEGFSGHFAIVFLKVFYPIWSLPQGWIKQKLCPYHRQYF